MVEPVFSTKRKRIRPLDKKTVVSRSRTLENIARLEKIGNIPVPVRLSEVVNPAGLQRWDAP
jgi:hypothetical protein